MAAALSAAAAIGAAEELGPEALRLRLLAAASLGIPLFTVAQLWHERHGRGTLARWASHAALALPPLAYYLLWPRWSEDLRALRYWQLSAFAHLLVAFLPFARRGSPIAFWQYNRALLERLLFAAATAVTLWGGLALALAALDKLFGVDVPDQGYGRLWFVMAFLFSSWFFLGGVPKDLDAPQERRDDLPALRLSAQYILVPLVSMYLVILTLYLGKVIVTWDWPSGWIGWLVTGVAASGIFTLLLVYPVAEDPEQRWIRAFARDFWLAVLPAVGMLWLALYQRIHQYGLTEARYFLLVLSLWLFGIALYFRFKAGARMLMIPASLAALALSTIAGPWGAYAVSARSQAGRLAGLLRAAPAAGTTRALPADSVREVSGVVRYLLIRHGAGPLARLVPDSTLLALGPGPLYGESEVRRVVGALGVPYVDPRARGGAGAFVDLTAAAEPATVVRGFDYLLPIGPPGPRIPPGDTILRARFTVEARSVRVTRGPRLLVEVALDSMLARGRGRPRGHPVPAAWLRQAASGADADVLVMVRRLRTREDSAGVTGAAGAAGATVRSVEGDVLVRMRRP